MMGRWVHLQHRCRRRLWRGLDRWLVVVVVVVVTPGEFWLGGAAAAAERLLGD